jgi:hypothetical protein
LRVQDDAFVSQTRMMMANVLPLLRENDTVFIDENAIYFDSPAFLQVRESFPVIGSLVKPNSEFWWPQWARITEITGLPFGTFAPLTSIDVDPFLPVSYPPTVDLSWSNTALTVFRCAEEAICVSGTRLSG